MSWTDDRVEMLTKLWTEGRTAAEIAQQLGDVTRNAVIGKAHRLGLSGRVSPIQQNKAPANDKKGVGMVDLKERMCRWPHGDPKDKDFHFCGERTQSGFTYCDKHAAQAYQAQKSKSIEKENEKIVKQAANS